MIKRLQFLVTILLLSVSVFAKAQTPPAVELIEEKQPKRWNLYAQNNTDEMQEAFLLVQGEGFRRSADRPTIKKVPPRSKVLMITLIPIKGVTPTYTKIFTFQEEALQTVRKRKGEGREEYVNIRPLDPKELTIFVEEDCPLCKMLVDFLNKNHYKYRKMDIHTHYKVREFMFDHLKKGGYKSGMVGMPVIMYQNRKHWSINDMEDFIKKYDWAGLK